MVLIDIEGGIFVRDEDAVHFLGNDGIRSLKRKKPTVNELASPHPVERVGARLGAVDRWLPEDAAGKAVDSQVWVGAAWIDAAWIRNQGQQV